ncbi:MULTISPECIES: site-2 protease family protein [Prosthecochloris]|uniref:Site-2 protease family protein n=1 Tax=Prosthecochloris vibrioformis TaxID=1098 RepID=A0A5C4S0M9_PROVB|nr:MULTISPECIES: site-2 protease family protein [Prosthecochloris]ANT64270.1 Zn-dependent protease protein [Prosthecochloris sp. CIB 2401]TNJ36692.1 site-2 protease family protein [Prosthecochloris vibrioformis]
MNKPGSRRLDILFRQRHMLHLLLLLTTLLTTMWAGTFWAGQPLRLPTGTESLQPFLHDLLQGAPYALSLVFFLGTHEFGHFLAALRHRIDSTLPYFIPLPPIPFFLNLGTLGAIIRLRQPLASTKALFDIGAAGPLAGFVTTLGILVYGFTHLPDPSWIYTIHPEYKPYGGIPEPPAYGTLILGKNLLYLLLEQLFRPQHLPPMHEMYHYPYLFAGWIGCFVTALNLIPAGQLDGGHIIYAMFGRTWHRRMATIIISLMILLGLPSFLEAILAITLPGIGFVLPGWIASWSWPGWLVWALVLKKVLGTRHPPSVTEHPLSRTRKAVGWLAIAIFILCFTPVPFAITT